MPVAAPGSWRSGPDWAETVVVAVADGSSGGGGSAVDAARLLAPTDWIVSIMHATMVPL